MDDESVSREERVRRFHEFRNGPRGKELIEQLAAEIERRGQLLNWHNGRLETAELIAWVSIKEGLRWYFEAADMYPDPALLRD